MKAYPAIIALICLCFSLSSSQAQATETVPLSLNMLAPNSIPAGEASTVTITGTGFEAGMSISLDTLGAVTTTVLDSTSLTISLPNTLPAGTYTLSATSTSMGDSASNTLNLLIEAPAITAPIVSSAEPQRLAQGLEATISIIGTGFTSDLIVRLEGFGLLPTTFVNSGALTAQVPASIAARNNAYAIVLINGQGLSYPTNFNLQIVAPIQATQIPAPSEAPLPTEAPPSISTAPLLQVSSYQLSAATVSAGQSTTLSFTVTNRGNATAQMITVALASTSAFVPAVGQVGIALPDLVAGASATGQMSITANVDIAAGSALLPLVLSYQNPMGESFSADAELSVAVNPSPNSSQLIIDAYVIEPAPSEAGQAITLRLTLFNVGDAPVSQVLLSLGASGSLLLPNGRGDALPIGDIAARQTAPVELSLLVNTNAEIGYQVQPIAISYFQNGEAHETSSNITVNIVASNRPQPLLLLNSYDTGTTILNPSSRFTLNIAIQNAGLADAHNTLISFGTLASDSGGESGDTNAGGTSSMTPSSTFAPLGTAGLVFVGDILSGGIIQASQDFMVTSNIASGVYPLPITLQYLLADGSSKQVTLNLSLVVIIPPLLQITLVEPLPESSYLGEELPLLLEIKNNGRDVSLAEAVFTATNGELIAGASIPLEILKAGESSSLAAIIRPSELGAVQISLSLHYMDELNQAQMLVFDYSTLAVSPEPIEEYPTIIETAPIAAIPPQNGNWFGQIMMALLGLGS